MQPLRAAAATAVCFAFPSLAAQLAAPYDHYLIDTGDADGALLHGNLTGDATDELVVFQDSDAEGSERRMAVYRFQGGAWRTIQSAALGDDVIFVDMLHGTETDRLLVFRRDHVQWLNADGWILEPLLSAPSIYNVPPLDVPHVEIARDVNGDERDDILLPDFDGYWVWLQGATPDAAWVGPAKLRAEPTAIAGLRSATYRPRAVYPLDYDGDGHTDLAFWEDERFVVYRAGDDGFDTEPLFVELPVEFGSDDFAVSFGIGGNRDANKDRVMLYAVDDYNGDGIGDLVTNTLMIDGLLDHSTRYDFYFGKRVDGGTAFARAPDTTIESDGIQGPFEHADYDNDGRKDLGMATFDIGIGKIIAALLTGSVRFDVDFYVMQGNAYPTEPNVTKTIKVSFSLRTGSVLSARWMTTGDVTGDGFADLLVPADGRRIEVYPGTGDADLFAEEPSIIAVDFPDTTQAGGVDVADLNGDGRDDILIRFPATDEDATNRVGVVLSR